MEINKRWLEEHSACSEGTRWFLAQTETDAKTVLKALLKDGKFDWANWTIVRLLTHTQRVQYAAYAAKQSLHFFEKAFPHDKRPRLAIRAALRFAKDPSEANRSAALSALSAALSAAESAARSAAESARSAAWSATYKKIIRYGMKFL